MEASLGDIKEEQRKLGQQLEKLSLDMKTGFNDIKELFAAHDERFNLLDKDVRLLKHQVNNSVRVATDVIQATVKDLKSSAQDVITATEVSMDVDRNLRPHVMKWTYWFSTTWMNCRPKRPSHPPSSSASSRARKKGKSTEDAVLLQRPTFTAISAPNNGKKFFDAYNWMGMSEDGEWVKKSVVTPQKDSERGSGSEEQSEDMDEDDTARTPMGESTPLFATPPPFGYSSQRAAGTSHEPRLHSLEASMAAIKEEQKRLGQTLNTMVTRMETGFDDIKQLLTAHTERFGTLDKDMRTLEHQVNDSIHVASNVIQDTVNEFKATSAELQTFVQKSLRMLFRPQKCRWILIVIFVLMY
ncbi:hypothetical protein CJ030_MR5G009659 [Morella rubra]|uniref:Uncharacterized protein n=1 Tax=Morella rubra TaxID=262757 RepID=A0A6A1VMW5_9ROSI|nr:hypothetical protein CJ030_MR5G009659 [Morella rubra]